MSKYGGIFKTLNREHWAERIIEDGDCWLWTGHRNRWGYARVGYQARTYLLHRLLYEASGGILIQGHHVHHTCENKACVNPDHLEQITEREHLARHGYENMRKDWERRRAQTHCKHGHEFTPENTAVYAGKRRCRACSRHLTRGYEIMRAADHSRI